MVKFTAGDRLRNIFFGVEDGLVSTTGVLFGVATATSESRFILIAGLITVVVEATSMGSGAYLSEKSSDDHGTKSGRYGEAVIDGILMFISYLLAGTICILPYAILDIPQAKTISVLLALASLFFLGYWPRKKVSRGIEVFVLAGLAILIGFIAGELMRNLSA